MLAYKVLAADSIDAIPHSLVPYGHEFIPGRWYEAYCGGPHCPGRPEPFDEHLRFHLTGFCGYWSLLSRSEIGRLLDLANPSDVREGRAVWSVEIDRIYTQRLSQGRTQLRSGRLRTLEPLAWMPGRLT